MKLSRVAACVTLVACTLAPSGAPHADAPGSYQNLKVFPKDIGKDQLIGAMQSISSALGVRCGFCHVRAGQEWDFASDEKPEKTTARMMMQMVNDINTEDLPKITTKEPGGPVQVRCRTCHHGQPRPFLIEDHLIPAFRTGGVDSLAAEYDALRAKHHGKDMYNFGENMLPELAKQAAGNDPAGMLAIAQLNLKYFPKSGLTYLTMAEAHAAMDRKTDAIADVKKAIEVDPSVKRDAERMLDELGGK